MITIVTDTAADLPGYVVEEFGIRVVSGKVSLDGQSMRPLSDVAASDFYGLWRDSGQTPAVAEPAVNDLGQVYQAILSEQPTADIISIHASDGLSEVVARARVAAAACGPERIKVIDSRSTSIGLGLLAREAAEMARQRRSVAAIVDALTRMRGTMQGHMVTETLDYLTRSGKLGTMDRMIGGLLAVKPILALNDGRFKLQDQRRSRAEALQTLSESVIRSGFAHSRMRIGVAHAVCEDEAHVLAREITAVLKPETLLVTEMGPSSGSLGGPGALAVFWASPR